MNTASILNTLSTDYSNRVSKAIWVSAATPLQFKKITLDDLPLIEKIIRESRSMTCDYTIGGIFMWIDYFNYEYCIYEDTLFISGVEENNHSKIAFSCPIGKLPLPSALQLLKDYCEKKGLEMQFSAIPADCLICFTTINPNAEIEELTDWADYVYEIENFITLSGKKMAKKRNHVNHFLSDYSTYTFEPITKNNIKELREWLVIKHIKEYTSNENESTSGTELEEFNQVLMVLDNFDKFGFEGAILRTSTQGIIAGFSLAEIINETAFIHIEKMDHSIPGAGETLAHLFAGYLKQLYPELKYCNREEDCGDEGLRRAKESWHPLMLLKKFNVKI